VLRRGYLWGAEMTKNLRSELEAFFDDIWVPAKMRRRPEPGQFEKVLTTIGQNENDDLLLKLFERAGANYRDPWSWYALMAKFAETLYLIPKGGAPKKHYKPSDKVIKRDFRRIAKAHYEKKREHICEEMQKAFKARYGNVPISTLATWVSRSGVDVRAVKREFRKRAAS
jgi:hypothetical protein